MRDALWMLAFLVLTLGGGLAIGFWARPDGWYARLTKPFFNPPDRVFAPVWTVLYVMIAIAGYRIFVRAPEGVAMVLWAAGLALNFIWSPIFFRRRSPALALVVVLALLAVNAAFVVTSWPLDRAAALLFVPYVAWVAFASLLNAGVVRLN